MTRPPTRGSPRARGPWKLVVGLMLAGPLLAGCLTAQGGTTGSLGRSLEDTASALSSAELGLRQYLAGRTLRSAVDTLVSDSLDQATEASAGIATVSPDTPEETADQARALGLVDDAVRSLAATRAYLEGSFDPALIDGGGGLAGGSGPGPRRPAGRTGRRTGRASRRMVPVKRLLGVALGILTAIGGFVDIGDLVTNAVVGSRFGLGLAWVVVVGVVGICTYAHMAGRVAAVSGRATFEIIRERLGARTAAANLAASFLINLMTVTAEVGGIALVLQLASGIHYLAWIPVCAFLVWLVIWRVKFKLMENVAGLTGLCLIVFAVALFLLGPNWLELAGTALSPTVPEGESTWTYWYYAVALFGAAMTPYEVFFFSSGAVEENWSPKDVVQSRINVLAGFPLGGLLSLSIAACATVVLLPRQIGVESLSQVVLPVAEAAGRIGLVVVLVGILAATFGAALETTLSSGYTLAQYFGWSWGKYRRARRTPRASTSRWSRPCWPASRSWPPASTRCW